MAKKKNAFFSYLKKRQKDIQKKGFGFKPLNEVASIVGPEWKALSKEEKSIYEDQAKKYNKRMKNDESQQLTTSGFSFAQLKTQREREAKETDELNERIRKIVSSKGWEDRIFFLIKTHHYVEEVLAKSIDPTGKPVKKYWPSEISIASFNFSRGIKKVYLTLVDTKKIPKGYAADARDMAGFTALPLPGDKYFEEREQDRDYLWMMKKIRELVQENTDSAYNDGFLLFADDEDIDSATGCLEWLAENIDDDAERNRHKMFLSHVRVVSIYKFLFNLCELTSDINPKYENSALKANQHMATRFIISKSKYDYKDEIACNYHASSSGCTKINHCCRSIVMRRIFLIFDEFLEAMDIPRKRFHNIASMGLIPMAMTPSIPPFGQIPQTSSNLQPLDTTASNKGSSSVFSDVMQKSCNKDEKRLFDEPVAGSSSETCSSKLQKSSSSFRNLQSDTLHDPWEVNAETIPEKSGHLDNLDCSDEEEEEEDIDPWSTSVVPNPSYRAGIGVGRGLPLKRKFQD